MVKKNQIQNTAEMSAIFNDPDLTDEEKAELLSVSVDEVRKWQEAAKADTGLAKSLAEITVTPPKSLEIPPVPDAPVMPEHPTLPDGRRAFTEAEQAAYNRYGGAVPVANIYDWAEKIDAGVIKPD